jgi:hypothetical protein
MRESGQSRVIGLLGVGFDTEDGHIRITTTEQYQVIMGSGETHNMLKKICFQLDETIKKTGRPLYDYSPEEFMEIVHRLY